MRSRNSEKKHYPLKPPEMRARDWKRNAADAAQAGNRKLLLKVWGYAITMPSYGSGIRFEPWSKMPRCCLVSEYFFFS